MKLLKLVATALLVGLHLPALADEYQDAVSKAFPGFQILGSSDIKLDKGRRGDPAIYDRVKDHPGLVVGRINSDSVMDFAALIRGSKKKTLPEDRQSKRPAMNYYDGYLVVCYGVGAGQYKCGKLDANPLRISMPTDYFLTKVSPREQTCEGSQKFRPPRRAVDPNLGFDPNAEPGTGIVRISFTTDAIGFRGSGEAKDYVFQPGGLYLECGLTG